MRHPPRAHIECLPTFTEKAATCALPKRCLILLTPNRNVFHCIARKANRKNRRRKMIITVNATGRRSFAHSHYTSSMQFSFSIEFSTTINRTYKWENSQKYLCFSIDSRLFFLSWLHQPQCICYMHSAMTMTVHTWMLSTQQLIFAHFHMLTKKQKTKRRRRENTEKIHII